MEYIKLVLFAIFTLLFAWNFGTYASNAGGDTSTAENPNPKIMKGCGLGLVMFPILLYLGSSLWKGNQFVYGITALIVCGFYGYTLGFKFADDKKIDEGSSGLSPVHLLGRQYVFWRFWLRFLFLNFFVWGIATYFIGGTVIGGKIEEGRYFLSGKIYGGEKGIFEVSLSLFNYSFIHTYSTIALGILTAIAAHQVNNYRFAINKIENNEK